MKFNEQSAVGILKTPRHKSNIESVKKQESQLRVFTEDLSFDEIGVETYWGEMLSMMKARSSKKFERVIEFARYPLPIVQISDSILNDFFKVFDGKNRFFNIEGDREISRLDDWIQEKDPAKWVEKTAHSVFKNKPNSFVVVDVDSAGKPYLIHIDSERLVDAHIINDEGFCGYIAFIHSQKPHEIKEDVLTTFFSVYDEENYFVFSKDSDQDNYILVSENKHGVGYCPAKTFIKTPSNSNNKFKRRVAFTSALSKMEDWSLFDIYRNYVDHYAPFPVTEAPERRCGNPICDDGVVAEEIILNAQTNETKTIYKTCDVCGGKDDGAFIMPGTHIGIKVKEEGNDGSGVFKMIFPDTANMKYVPEKLDDLELEIRYKTVGLNTMVSNEAINELQVKGSFASMESVLLRTKEELDAIYSFIVETAGKLMYKDLRVEVEANFGTEFYLISEDDLQKRYEQAKNIGLPMEELLMIYTQLIETKYKGNPLKVERQLMLLQLDPLPLYSTIESLEMRKNNLIDDFTLSLKINFLNFIAKFESENAPVTQFGINLEMYQRIEKIKNTLIIYNNETIASKQPSTSESGTGED